MYNTVKELHIALDLQLQYLNSDKVSNIEPEEKDWIINESIYEFVETSITDKVKEGFEETLLRYEDIKELKASKALTVYSENEDLQYVVLPQNYLVKPKGIVKLSIKCPNNPTELSDKEVGIYVIPFTSIIYSGKYYTAFDIKFHNTGNSNELTIEHYNQEGYNDPSSKFIIIADMINQINKLNGFELYWERYGDRYEANSFIIVDLHNDDTYNIVTLDYNGFNYVRSKIITTLPIMSLVNESSQVLSGIPCRTMSSKYIHEILRDEFATTNPASPLIEVIGNKAFIHTDSRFIIDELTLDYIKKPVLVNYKANVMTDVKRHSVEIISIAVRKIKAFIDDSNYKSIINENLITNL